MTFTPKDHDYPQGTETSVRLYKGGYIDLLNPSVDDIHIQDIAHALSHICRFGGHTANLYSVAEHSLHVAAMLYRQYGDPTTALKGLLHDAAEAYLGDMVRPLKHAPGMEGYRVIEKTMEQRIAYRFELGSLDSPLVKAADSEILVWEMAMFRDSGWRRPNDEIDVFRGFMVKFGEYTRAIKARADE